MSRAARKSLQNEPEITNRFMILNAAERVFGRFGYDGASMRQISEEAGVAQALLHYHFGTKENLYTAVFERRSSAINGHRGRLLDELFTRSTAPTIEDVLTIAFTPLTDIFEGGDAENLALYVQLVATISLGNDERSKLLRSQFYDPIALRFAEALQVVAPGLRRDQAVWAYLFSIGARQQAHSLNGRAARLGAKLDAGSKSRYVLLVRFAAAGIRQMIEGNKAAVGKVRAITAGRPRRSSI